MRSFRRVASALLFMALATRVCPTGAAEVIHDAEYRQQMVDHNYELGKAFFSYSVLRRKLRALITNVTGMDDL